MLRKLSSTNYPVLFFMADSTDHATGKTGLSLTVLISKNGGAFNPPAGAVSEVGNGFYALAGNATDRNTLGTLSLYATGVGADATHYEIEVVNYDPFDLPLSGSDILIDEIWNHPNRTLTYSPTNVISIQDAGFVLTRGDDFSWVFTGIDMTNFSKAYFTLKRNYKDTDANSIIQVNTDDGLVILNGITLDVDPTWAVLEADELLETITLTLTSDVTAVIPYSIEDFVFDIQTVDLNGIVSTPYNSTMSIIRDVTRTGRPIVP